jgi:hypothetical protein
MPTALSRRRVGPTTFTEGSPIPEVFDEARQKYCARYFVTVTSSWGVIVGQSSGNPHWSVNDLRHSVRE